MPTLSSLSSIPGSGLSLAELEALPEAERPSLEPVLLDPKVDAGKGILRSYWKLKPNGQPDYAAMATTEFYNSLPPDIRAQYTANQLGATFKAKAASMPTHTPINLATTAPGQANAFTAPVQAYGGANYSSNPSAASLANEEYRYLAQSQDPADAAKLSSMVGAEEYHRLQNYYNGGGAGHNPQSIMDQYRAGGGGAQGIDTLPAAVRQMYEANGIISGGKWAKKQDANGQWVDIGANLGGGVPAGGSSGSGGTPAAGGVGSAPPASGGAGGSFGAAGQGILGSYWKTKPDGTPDYAAMGDPAFFNALPEDMRRAYTAAGLGAQFKAAAVPAGGSTPLGNSGASGELPVASAEAWKAPTAPNYTAPVRPEEINKPFDLFNDEGYKFMLEEGTKGIQNSAAARGGLKSGNTLKALAKYQTGLASQEYGNAYGRYNTDRNFSENQFTGDRNFGRGTWESDRGFNFGAATNERDYNNANRMWDTSFNNNNRIDARNFDYSANINDRNFNYARDVDNRNFGYNADTGDRSYNTNTLMGLANMGLNASGNSGQLAATLAAILGQNTMTGAGAGANAGVGVANNTNQFISQLLAALYGTGGS